MTIERRLPSRSAGQRPRSLRGLALVLWVVAAVATVTAMPGCGGCSQDDQSELERRLAEQKERKEKAKRKAPFDLEPLRVQPTGSDSVLVSAFKPGHWTSATIQAIANEEDFAGRLITEPLPLDGMPYQLGTSRPAVLPKSQPKDLELVFFVPPGHLNARISTRLFAQNSDRELARRDEPATRMPARQFHLVVLSPQGERYTFLNAAKMYTVRPPRDSFGRSEINYRVVIPTIDHRVSLPSHWLTWTSIAYILWDGVEPSSLSLDQQQALIDWLHWGGQLIISGPESLDLLHGSFLAPYLPATPAADVELEPADLETFNLHWTRWGTPLSLSRPWPAKRLQVATGDVRTLAEADNDLPLVVDRRVGRGRVVLTAFRLTQRELAIDAWPSFDGFFHSCLLGLPPRRLVADREILEFAPEEAVRVQVERGSLTAAEINSRLRIMTRDVDRLQDSEWATATGVSDASLVASGVAGWSSFNGAARDARLALREAAGIYIPEASFIAKLLGLYLLVLVPGNWLVFRLLGRVEWCWIAAPIITLVFALVVVREAQLDIGFARARTDVAVVEMQGGYPRAHVTRYTALYASLTTAYDLSFDDPGALVQPFPLFTLQELARQPRLDLASVYYHSDAGGVTLDGFEVRSNALGMLHCEHTLDAQGTIEAVATANGSLAVRNGSRFELRDAAVIDENGRVAWLGDLPAHSPAKPLEFRYASLEAFRAEHPRFSLPTAQEPAGKADSAEAAEPPAEGEPTAEEQPAEDGADNGTTPASAAPVLADENPVPVGLWQRFASPDSKDSNLIGSLRLLAFTDEPLAGMTVEPAASQNRHLALVVVNLQYAPPPQPQPDSIERVLQEALSRVRAAQVDEAEP